MVGKDPGGVRGRSRRRTGRAGLAIGLVVSQIMVMTATGMAASSASRELKRTARRLQIAPESVTLARQALREVTDIAFQLPTFPLDQMYPLVQSWARLNAPEAVTQSERIFRVLRTRLAQAEPGEVYGLQNALATVIQVVAPLDPERAWTLWQQWPVAQKTSEGSTNGGDIQRPGMGDQLRAQARRTILSAMTACHPDRAAQLLQEALSTQPDGAADRDSLLSLMPNMNPEMHARLAQDAVKAYEERPLNPENLNKQISLLQNLSWSEPEIMGPAALDLAKRLKADGGDGLAQQSLVLHGRQATVELGGAEQTGLQLLRLLRMQPGLMMQVLGEFPSLSEKLNQVGGLDAVLRGGSFTASSDGSQVEDLTVDPRKRVNGAAAPSPETPFDGNLCSSQDARLPQWRRKLQEMAAQEDGFEPLLRAAQMLSGKNPDLAEEAVRLAESRLTGEEVAPAVKAERWVRLIGAYVEVDSDLDSNLIEKALAAIAALDEASPEKEDNPKPSSLRPDRSGQLQAQLFSYLGRSDLRRALDRARLLPDTRRKMAAMLQILNGLAGGGYGGWHHS